MGRPPAAQRTGPVRASAAFPATIRAAGEFLTARVSGKHTRRWEACALDPPVGWKQGMGWRLAALAGAGSCTAVVPLYHGRLNSSYPTFRINPKLIQMHQLRHSCPTPEVGKNKARPSQTTKHASPDDQSPTSTALTTRTDIEGGGGGEGFVKNSGSTKTARSPWQRKAIALT